MCCVHLLKIRTRNGIKPPIALTTSILLNVLTSCDFRRHKQAIQHESKLTYLKFLNKICFAFQ